MRVVASCLVVGLLAAGLAGSASAAAADAGPVRLDIGLAAGADPAAVLTALGDAVLTSGPVPGLDAITVDVPADRATAALSLLATTAGVRYAEPGATLQADSETVSTGFVSMRVTQAWTWTAGDPGVTVAVVDSGVSPTAELPAGRLVAGHDFVDGDADAADGDGHGTLVATLIGGEAGNDIGAAGVCHKCSIMPVRVLAGGTGTSADVAAGIVWAADHGAPVINLSLSTASPSRLLQDAVEHAAARNALVVASSGNVASTAHRYPAAFAPALAVGQAGTATKNTAADQWVGVVAYSNYLLIGRDGTKGVLTGASGATATVSGVAALAFALNPGIAAADVRAAVQRDADPRAPATAYQPSLVNAARTIHDLGGADTAAPTGVTTGLTENMLIGRAGRTVVPWAGDDHGVDHTDLVVGGQVVASSRYPLGGVVLRPPAGFNGPMPVTAIAYDFAGNTDRTTTVVRADTLAPVAKLITPVPGAVVHGSQIDVIVQSPETDPGLFYSMTDTHVLNRVAGTDRWQARVVLPATGEVWLSLEDSVHNRTEVKTTVRVDNAPPAGGVIAPAPGARVRGTFTSSLSGVTDLGGVARAELWVNGRYAGADSAAPYALPVRTTASGNVALVWRVTDRFGQYRTLPARTVVADNTPPSVAVTSAPANGARVTGTVKVAVKASDAAGIARVELLVNGKVVARDSAAGYLLTVDTKKVARTMKVQVRAYDRLGNVRYTSARTWRRR